MVGCFLPPDVVCLMFLGPAQLSKGVESISEVCAQDRICYPSDREGGYENGGQ
jgi:hypothetical protein